MHRRALVKPQRRNMCTISSGPRIFHVSVLFVLMVKPLTRPGSGGTRFSNLNILLFYCKS